MKKDNNDFKLNTKLIYNVDREILYKNYENIFYVHPLDKDDECKTLYSDNEIYYLCTICKKCIKSQYKLRSHQWKEHLKPFGTKIRKELKKKADNK